MTVVDRVVPPVDWPGYHAAYHAAGWPDVRDVTLWDVRGWPLQFDKWGALGWRPLPECYSLLARGRFAADDCREVLTIGRDDYAAADRHVSLGRPLAVIQGGRNIASPWKWSGDRRARVAGLLRRLGFDVVALAAEDTHATIPNTRRVYGLSVRAAAALLARADLYVGSDTGITWLATLATSVPVVAITRPELATAGSFLVRPGVREITHDKPEQAFLDLVGDVASTLEVRT